MSWRTVDHELAIGLTTAQLPNGETLPRPDHLGFVTMIAQQAAEDVARVPTWAAPARSRIGRASAVLALSVGYIALYLTLDRFSFIEAQHGIGITPWSPSAGLALALLIIKGPRWFPAVFAAELLSGATLPEVAVPSVPIFIAAVLVTGGYAGATAVLRRLGFEAGLHRTSDVALLIVVTIASSGLAACGYVTAYAAAGVAPWSGFQTQRSIIGSATRSALSCLRLRF